MKLRSLVCTVFLLAAGCAVGPPTAQELSRANYGPPIVQSEAEELVKSYMGKRLKDPYSAVYEFGIVQSAWWREAPIAGGRIHFGYGLEVSVNARNSFGGYTGAKRYKFYFYDGMLVASYELTPEGFMFPF